MNTQININTTMYIEHLHYICVNGVKPNWRITIVIKSETEIQKEI